MRRKKHGRYVANKNFASKHGTFHKGRTYVAGDDPAVRAHPQFFDLVAGESKVETAAAEPFVPAVEPEPVADEGSSADAHDPALD